MKITRIDSTKVEIETNGLRLTLFANESVDLDRGSFEEIEQFSEITTTLDRLNSLGYFKDQEGKITNAILTPDFHKGAGMPVGMVLETESFILPKAIGTDIGCGMRLLVTDMTRDEFASLSNLDNHLRWMFFEGGRNLSLSPDQRIALFRDGLPGLIETKHDTGGLWDIWSDEDQTRDVIKCHNIGQWPTNDIFYQLDGFIKGSGNYSRDDQIGTIGGGVSNHFVEIQTIDDIFDRHMAYEWGLRRDHIVIMVHTGSVGVGQMIGKHYTDKSRQTYPSIEHPKNGFYPLTGDIGREYMSAMANAANFAFANRLFLGLIAIKSLSDVAGRKISSQLVYDAPHNLLWDSHRHIHRKGACPAHGPDSDFPMGHPVIIPGSIGDSSYLMAGKGNKESLCSCCHGAGRIKPRQGQRKETSEFDQLRVITRIDPTKVRSDIAKAYLASMAEEAPSAYKEITPVIDTVVDSNIASKVARLNPLLTIKSV
ncbi:MAG: RtcB family protein [Candidimonas sp.]